MPASIEAKEKEIMRVFSDDYLFQIPQYQRPYAWTTEEVDELLDDLLNAMKGDDDIEDLSPYFLGNIVLIKRPNNPNSEVVDGQQRLTTLTILLCVLRELSKGRRQRNLDSYIRQEADEIAGRGVHYRLDLRERDRDFFRNNVQTMGHLGDFLNQNISEFTDSQEHIHENAEYIWEKLQDMDEEKRKRLAMFLVQRCYLVVVSASDRNSAYRIFSVMNTRGLNLSPTDILKAEIIGEMPESDRKDYTKKWEDIEDILGREDFHDLFSHIRMIYMKAKARRNLNQEFRDGVLNQNNIGNDEFIDNVLTPMSDAYRIISKANHQSADNSKDINKYLRYLKRLDNYDWIPSAVSYFKEHTNDKDHLLTFIRDLERLAYGLFILRRDVNDRISRYARVLSAIDDNVDMCTEDSPLQLSDDEKREILNQLNGAIYLQKKARKPILLRLDSLIADGGILMYEDMIVTIEHVLPQQPAEGSQWLEWFPDDEIREEWTHKIANLVLLSRKKNSQAQNYDFERKKNEYFQGDGIPTYALTVQVLHQNEWTLEILKKRQTELINRLAEEWRLR